MTSLLELRNVSRRFGGLAAVSDVTFDIRPGTIVGLIGPNGAGKTTLVNLISGALKPSTGDLLFKGQRIGGLLPHRISRLGIARTFQIVQPFPEMTALENVAAAATFAGKARNLRDANKAAEMQLERVGLRTVASVQASLLSLGQRKRLELAKSLAMNPDLLLLDEVNAGLHGPELAEAIGLIRSSGKGRDHHSHNRTSYESGDLAVRRGRCPAPWKADRARTVGKDRRRSGCYRSLPR